MTLPLVNLWKERSLIFYFFLINLKIFFKKTSFGLLWAGLMPTLLFFFFYVLFSSIGLSSKDDFAMYLFVGIVFYFVFAEGTLWGLSSIHKNYLLLTSCKIKSELFPVVSTSTSAIFLGIGTGILFLFAPVFNHQVSLSWALLPLPMLLLLGLILGLSYILSILYNFFKGTRYFWQMILFALFFITPIFWYLDDATGFAFMAHQVNPLGQVTEIAHNLILNNIPSFAQWIHATLLVVIILFSGYFFFQKFEKNLREKM